ncbi:hypothetical protein L1987_39179 [Smallanthus sonchifolius]|uniref:Uncharacterized protein n=1 Tax=Smallanthus sonchifolius TaxID=185202 RepID=A0ACB9HL40_9ASTR|nr:hypothetical protein L1987_39179 [Smallanthus sonchifolius]
MNSFPSSEEDSEICEKHKQLLETLPKGSGWRVQHVYNYNGFWLDPKSIKNNLLLHTYFRSQPTDIFLASFMKSGTTWLKALMFSTLNRHRYSFSDHHLHNHSPQSTFPFLDSESYPITDFTNMSVPRLFATHFPRTLLPACMSSCNLESPDKILFLKYEDIKEQPEVVVRKLAAFMGKPFTVEEEEVREIVKLCSFENLSNLEVNKKGVDKFGTLVEVERRYFFRKGEIGDWKNYLSEEMKERIDAITDVKFQGSGLILNAKV